MRLWRKEREQYSLWDFLCCVYIFDFLTKIPPIRSDKSYRDKLDYSKDEIIDNIKDFLNDLLGSFHKDLVYYAEK